MQTVIIFTIEDKMEKEKLLKFLKRTLTTMPDEESKTTRYWLFSDDKIERIISILENTK
jgi:hypothetical protein